MDGSQLEWTNLLEILTSEIMSKGFATNWIWDKQRFQIFEILILNLKNEQAIDLIVEYILYLAILNLFKSQIFGEIWNLKILCCLQQDEKVFHNIRNTSNHENLD